MKFLAIAVFAIAPGPTHAYSNQARMCDALYGEIEHVARQYQQAVRLGSSSAYTLKAKGQRMMRNLPAECR